MCLYKDNIAKWIRQNIANDYFAYENICSEVTVLNFKKSGTTLIIEYEFWDDGKAIPDLQDNFLFDIAIGAEYGVNFPVGLQLYKFEDTFSWANEADLENLKQNYNDLTSVVLDVRAYKWGDEEINSWINHYISALDQKSMALMLLEKFNADVSFPKFIPECLAPHFKKIISNNA